MKVLVTGAAGFIGSHLCEALIKKKINVIGIDNLKRGVIDNLTQSRKSEFFNFELGDVSNIDFLNRVLNGCSAVYHLADESDIQFALSHPESYFKDNINGLFSILTSMHSNGIKKIFFPSSTTVFGSKAPPPISEKYGPLQPESLYGAAKAAAEAFLHAWGHAYDLDILIFRFAAVIGGKQDHGVIHDFIKRLTLDPSILHVFGNGEQVRSFVLIDDCVEIIINFFMNKSLPGYQIVHLGNPDTISIKRVAEIACDQFSLSHDIIKFADNSLGWIGDSKTNQLDMETLNNSKIMPKYNTHDAVIEAARRLKKQYNYLIK